ncbi:MAG: hypoxanthine phosphoribosyltransferase [Oscillospiraceae bacterium]|nr:hypoxanthine phosphoribosyltransferase [Oscillospiraceae bacterium]
MVNDIREVLLTKEEIEAVVKELGKKITEDYKGKNLFLITVLKGAVVFLGDLMRAIEIPCEIEFMVLSSYGSGTTSTGSVKIVKDIDLPLEGKDVLIVEDILDTGFTLSFLVDLLKSRNPKSIEICTLLDKPDRRKVEISAKYTGRKIPDEFVVGYGLDYDEKYRNLPFIGVLKPEVYSN